MEPKTIIFSILLSVAVIAGIYFLLKNSKSDRNSAANDICSHCGELKCNPETGECIRPDICNNISKPDDTTDCKNVCVRNRWICEGTDKCEKNTLPASIGSCSLEQLVCDTDLDQLYCPSSLSCNGNPLYFDKDGVSRCVCQNGSRGNECQYTNAGTCNNHGTVSDDGSCTCQAPYYGKMCESQCSAPRIFDGTSCVCDPKLYTTVDDKCVLIPCANGTLNKTTGVCDCDDGYTNDTNDNKKCISKCDLQTQVWKGKCVKKSTCTDPTETVYDADGNFTCVCTAGACGLNCEYTRADTCHNNGTPICLNNGFKGCKCDDGYTGNDCSCKTLPVPNDYTNDCLGEFPVCNNGNWSTGYKTCNDKINSTYSIDQWNTDCFAILKDKDMAFGKISDCKDARTEGNPSDHIVPIFKGCTQAPTKSCPDITQVNLCDFDTDYNWGCVPQINSSKSGRECLPQPIGAYCIDQNGKQDSPICYPCGPNGGAEWICNNEGSLPSEKCIEANGIKTSNYSGDPYPIYINSQQDGLPVYPTTDANACESFLSGKKGDPFSLGLLGIFNVASKLGNPKKASITQKDVIKLDDNDGNRYFLPYSLDSIYDKDVRCPFPDDHVIKYIVGGTSGSNLCNGGKFNQKDNLASGTCECLPNYVGSNCEVPANIVIAIDNTESIPSGWLECNGSSNTPNLAGRFVMGVGIGGSFGATGGNSSHSITVDEMYPHSHTYRSVQTDTEVRGPSNGEVSCVISTGDYYSDKSAQRPTITKTSTSTGKNTQFSYNPPYLAVSYITTNSPSSSIPLGAIIWFYNKNDMTKAPIGWEIYTKATGKLLVGKNETFKNIGGNENVTLTSDNLPSHNHDYTIQYSTVNQCARGTDTACLDQSDNESNTSSLKIVDTNDTPLDISINIMPMYINLMCIRKTGNTGFAVGSICALYNNVYPSDWTICDGNNNTPDLRGYFIRSSTQDIGIKGGNINNKITIPAIPHTHKTEYYQDTNKEKLCNNSTLFVNDVYVSTASSPTDFYHSYPDRWPTNMNTTTPVGKGNNIDISPPYYTLLYIMKFK